MESKMQLSEKFLPALGRSKYRIAKKLRYGENPRQADAVLVSRKGVNGDPFSVTHGFDLVAGRGQSYINVTDLDRVLATATRLGAACELNFGRVPYIAVAVKHGHVCGAAISNHMPDLAIRKMIESNPEAIYGGTVLLNVPVCEFHTGILREYLVPHNGKRLLDAIVAPLFDPEAIRIFKRTKNLCNLFTNPALDNGGLGANSIDTSPKYRQVRGGFAVQDGDPYIFKIPEDWKLELKEDDLYNMVIGWAIGSTAVSNSIVLTNMHMLFGAGVGQIARHMAAEVALLYARKYHKAWWEGMVAYSDSFFPFADGPKILCDAGIKTIFATSGSVRDQEVIDFCASQGVKLFTLPDKEARGFCWH